VAEYGTVQWFRGLVYIAKGGWSPVWVFVKGTLVGILLQRAESPISYHNECTFITVLPLRERNAITRKLRGN
jgi:hypothetical protein